LVSRWQKRAARILVGDIEHVLDRIVEIDPDRPPQYPAVPVYITRPVMFVQPTSDGRFTRRVLSEATSEEVIKVARHVVAFCRTMQRFAGQEFLRDLTFELDAVTSVFCHGSSFRTR
jgi:hypothetical protein